MISNLKHHYGFSKVPFGRDLAPSMLHRHDAHAQATARITFCIQERGLGVVIGEVGAGKTVALRAAVEALDPSRHVLIYLPNPTVGVRGFHHAVVSALGGVPKPHHATLFPQALDAIANEHAERGRTPVLAIDEAHMLQPPQLEAIRMLSNHELDSGSPMACLLIGQPTLRRNIRLGILAALDQRITMRYTMEAMSREDTTSYIHHHVKLALLTELPMRGSRTDGQPMIGPVTFPGHDGRRRHTPGSGRAGRCSGWCAPGDRRPVGALPAPRR